MRRTQAPHFQATALAGAVALLAALPVFAQQQPAGAAEAVQTVEVRGTRASLERSIALKRDASVVMDSITATELGRFPDNNVADSLAHITGVSIKRTAGGEGMKVMVRGLGAEYTLTTFNNRLLGTDGPGRDFAFDVLPSDVIAGADVIKSTQASLMEGSIGGLIGLRSASPFDRKGQHGSIRLEGDRNLMSRLNGAKVSAVYSNTFAGDTMGMMLGLVLADRKVRTDTAGNDGGWSRNAVPSDPSWAWGNTWGGAIDPNGNGTLDPSEEGLIGPGQFRIGSVMEQKKRTALSGKFEWRPSKDLKVVADGIFTRLDSPQIGYQQSYYSLYAPGRWTDMKITNGIVTDLTIPGNDPDKALYPELLNKSIHRVVDTSMMGLNAEWKFSPALSFTGDGYVSKSKRHSGGQDSYVVLRMNQPASTHIQLTGAPIPQVTTTLNDGRDLATGTFGASDFNTHYFQLAGDNIDDRIGGLSLAGKWVVDRFYIEQVQFGLSHTDRKKSRDLVNNDINGGSGAYSGGNAINVGTLGEGVISHRFQLPNFMNKVDAQFPRSFLAFDVPTYIQALKNFDAARYAAAAPVWNPLESYRVTEKTTASFVQLDMAGEKWTADAGLRFVNTRTTSRAWDAKLTSITALDDWTNTMTYGDPTPIEQRASYNFVLPSANFIWNFDDKLKLRLAAAKTMARPPVDKLAPTNTTASVAWKEYTQIYGGNAELKPYSAVQGDVSLEWYYAPRSIFNVALFQKNIKNQITTSWETNQDIGAPNGQLFNVMRPINGDHAKVRGIEVGLQHLWENGFGVRASFTRNIARSWVGDEVRPLEGIAPSVASLGMLYEKGPWSFNIQADHSRGFVTAVNVLGSGYNEMIRPVTWLTASLGYDINDRFRVHMQGSNLLDAQEKYTISGNTLLPQGYNRYGRAVELGLTIRF